MLYGQPLRKENQEMIIRRQKTSTTTVQDMRLPIVSFLLLFFLCYPTVTGKKCAHIVIVIYFSDLAESSGWVDTQIFVFDTLLIQPY